MDVSKPLIGLFPTVDSAVLSVLAGSTTPRTGREIARLAERSHTAVSKVLDRFVEQGLVEQEEVGRSHVYVLNRDHVAYPAIEGLTGLKVEFYRRTRELLEGWDPQPIHASIFGSTARGDGDAHSDIDIFLVRPKEIDPDDETWQAQLDRLASSVRSWTGNQAGLIEVGQDELAELAKQKRPVLKEIRSDGVDLAGKSVRQLLRGLS